MEQLGIESSLLLAQIINFLIVLVVLSKLLYKPILRTLEKRRREIDEGLARAERMKQQEEKMQQKKEYVVAEARREAREIIEQAKKTAQEEEKNIVEKAHKQSAAVLEKGKDEVAEMKRALEKDVRRETLELATRMVQQLLTQGLSPQEQRKLLDKHLKILERGISTS